MARRRAAAAVCGGTEGLETLLRDADESLTSAGLQAASDRDRGVVQRGGRHPSYS